MSKSKAIQYTVEVVRDTKRESTNKKPKWHELSAIAVFWVSKYKNAAAAKRAAGKLAVGLYKGECRVFVVTDYFIGDRFCHRMEEVTETEEGIL